MNTLLNPILPVIILFCMSLGAMANCPKELYQDKQGFWHSDSDPGWKSNESTQPHPPRKIIEFGGAVFSPRLQRVACVYRTHHGEWIAMLSKKQTSVKIDQYALDQNGNKAWAWSEQYNDYACGIPYIKNLNDCAFSITIH